MSLLPSDIKDIVSEYKKESFRVTGKVVTLNWAIRGKGRYSFSQAGKIQSIPLTLKKGIWHYIMSPFVRRYVNFHRDYDNVSPGSYTLARCYTLIFYHSEFDITQLPHDIPNFPLQNKREGSVVGLTFCSGNETPLLNIAFNNTFVIPAQQMYCDQEVESSYLIIPTAEINKGNPDPPEKSEKHMKKMKKKINEVIKGTFSTILIYPFPAFILDIGAKEATKKGLSDGKRIILQSDYSVDRKEQEFFIVNDKTKRLEKIDEKEYPILREITSILSQFDMKNLRHDETFDTEYRKSLIRDEIFVNKFYNNNHANSDSGLENEMAR